MYVDVGVGNVCIGVVNGYLKWWVVVDFYVVNLFVEVYI